jgi:hypothetical protein
MSTVDTRNILGQAEPPLPPNLRERDEVRATAEVVRGGSITESACAIGAGILAILSLAGLFVTILTPISTIALGAALFLGGASVAMRYGRMLTEVAGPHEVTVAELGGGMTAELFGGVAGMVLGVLALLRIAPVTLMAVAVVVFGASLVIGCGATARMSKLVVAGWNHLHDQARHVANEIVTAAAGAQLLTGLAGIVLGIIALIGVEAWVLTAVGLLCMSAAAMLGGAAISGRMMSLLRR